MSKIDQVVEIVMGMSVPELVELGEVMQKKFGVSALTMPVVGSTASASTAVQEAVQEEKTDFKVVMTDFGANKINVIKVVRTITGLGLKEAKDMVEGIPSTIKEGIAKADAENIKKQLEEAGATVAIS